MRRWFFPIAYAALLFWISDQPSPAAPQFGLSDKILHIGAYAVLGFLVARAATRRFLLFAFLAATFYGLFDELHQSFVPGRMMEFWDWIADILGGILGGSLYVRLKQWGRFSRITG